MYYNMNYVLVSLIPRPVRRKQIIAQCGAQISVLSVTQSTVACVGMQCSSARA